MAFSAGNPPRAVLPLGFASGGSAWLYKSSDANAAVTATGYFAGCGAGSRSGPQIGMHLYDLVIVQESSLGASPGKISFHSVIGATADQASTAASTGYKAGYNVSLSTGT